MESILHFTHEGLIGRVGKVGMLMLACWIVTWEPWSGYRSYSKFMELSARNVPGIRSRMYRRWSLMQIALGAITVTLFVIAPGLKLSDLGLRLPVVDASVSPIVLGIVGGLMGGIIAGFIAMKSGRHKIGVAGAKKLMWMMPGNRAERLEFMGLCLCAAVVEEIVWRGFLIFFFATSFPGLGLITVVGVASLIFGIAHLYQGWSGVLLTSILAVILCALYLSTGSLLIPMVLHLVIDIRAIWMIRGQDSELPEMTSA